MIIRSTAAMCAALALGSVAAGQSFVFPSELLDAEGSLSAADHTLGAPWWSNPAQGPNEQHFRQQVIVDMPSAVVGNISTISYRRDGAFQAGFTFEQFSVELEVTLSTSVNSAASASSMFGANTGADARQVIARKTVVFGSKQFVGSFPEPFVFDLVLDTPFPYDGSKGSLCMDIKHYSNDMMHPLRLTPLFVEVDAADTSNSAVKLRNGSRCSSPNPWVPSIDLHTELEIDDSAGPPMVNFYAWRQFGQHHSRGFLIASLALAATPSVVPDGGSGACGSLHVDMFNQILFAIGSSNERGFCRWPSADPSTYIFQLPYNAAWAGSQFYAQELNFDVHTQAWAATNWVLTQVPTYLGPGVEFPVRVLHADGVNSHAAVQGTLGPLGKGPVLQFAM